MIQFLKNLIRPSYESLNRIEILSQNILENIQILQSLQPQAEIFPVLKSNAYGHGLKEICQMLQKSSVTILAVDSFPEAQIVYRHTNKQVLVLGETLLDTYRHFDFRRTEFCIYNSKTLRHLASLQKNVHVHLFINTGMNREGIQDIKIFLEENKKFLEHVKIVGLCSHLASGDDISDLNKKQQERFFDSLDILHQYNIFPKWVHLGNSAGTFILHDKRLTAFRPGISSYGYNVFPKNHSAYSQAQKLQPALRVVSHIVSIQKLKKGDTVSYNETYIAPKDMHIAIIPFGYFEGLDRRLSSNAVFFIQNKPVSLVGRVCMNLCCIDVGSLNVSIGDEVEIISPNVLQENSVQNIADKEKTIPYEVLVKLHGGIRKMVK